jgi:hypothetical protein
MSHRSDAAAFEQLGKGGIVGGFPVSRRVDGILVGEVAVVQTEAIPVCHLNPKEFNQQIGESHRERDADRASFLEVFADLTDGFIDTEGGITKDDIVGLVRTGRMLDEVSDDASNIAGVEVVETAVGAEEADQIDPVEHFFESAGEVGVGFVVVATEDEGGEDGGNFRSDRQFGKLLIALILRANVVRANVASLGQGLVLAIENTGSREVDHLLAEVRVEQVHEADRFDQIDFLNDSRVAPSRGSEDRTVDRLEQSPDAFNLAHVAFDQGNAGAGVVIELEFAGVADEQEEIVGGGLDQGFGEVVTNAATGACHENAHITVRTVRGDVGWGRS